MPVLVTGGGGYTLRNVPRVWTYETSVCLGYDIPNEIPDENEYKEYFCPEYKLHMSTSNMENLNSRSELDEKIAQIKENLKHVTARTVDLSNYHNGHQQVPNHLDYDESKQREKVEELKQDENTDTKQ